MDEQDAVDSSLSRATCAGDVDLASVNLRSDGPKPHGRCQVWCATGDLARHPLAPSPTCWRGGGLRLAPR